MAQKQNVIKHGKKTKKNDKVTLELCKKKTFNGCLDLHHVILFLSRLEKQTQINS